MNNGPPTPLLARSDSFIGRASVGAAMGFWRRTEDHLLRLQHDRARMARYLQVAWWISNAFLGIGVVVIFLIVTGLWRP